MAQIPDCDRCRCYAHSPYLVCAIHPTGADGNECPDFQAAPSAEQETLWEPIGASYYNGELILQPQSQWSLLEQLRLLDWHPIFTGRCPECEMPILQAYPSQVHWDCSSCDWKDDSI